jgi:hypothetical protein
MFILWLGVMMLFMLVVCSVLCWNSKIGPPRLSWAVKSEGLTAEVFETHSREERKEGKEILSSL